MAALHGVDPDQVTARGWPSWLMLALPGPDIRAPFTDQEVALSALDDLAAGPAGADTPLLPPAVLRDLTSQWTVHITGAIARGIAGGYVGVEVLPTGLATVNQTT